MPLRNKMRHDTVGTKSNSPTCKGLGKCSRNIALTGPVVRTFIIGRISCRDPAAGNYPARGPTRLNGPLEGLFRPCKLLRGDEFAIRQLCDLFTGSMHSEVTFDLAVRRSEVRV